MKIDIVQQYIKLDTKLLKEAKAKDVHTMLEGGWGKLQKTKEFGTYVCSSCVPGRRADTRAEHASVDRKPWMARPLRLHATNHHP